MFFGQLAPKCEQAKEVPVSMRLPMWIMAGFCLLTGILPGLVNRFLIVPATAATLNITGYIDAMMGTGYAQMLGGLSGGVLDFRYHLAGYCIPVAWLLLFIILMARILIAVGAGRGSRGPVCQAAVSTDPKYATFFGGEESRHSHLGGSDLFWGLKHNLRHYFRFMHGLHNGVVNDYALWAVMATVAVVLFMFIFL